MHVVGDIPKPVSGAGIDLTESLVEEHYGVAELWFEDGSVVIQAEKSLFRISRAILGSRSPVFKDIFTCAESLPESERAYVEGCAYIRVSDSAQDMTYFLKAIFDSEFVPVSFVALIH